MAGIVIHETVTEVRVGNIFSGTVAHDEANAAQNIADLIVEGRTELAESLTNMEHEGMSYPKLLLKGIMSLRLGRAQ